jgi:hypothetical protein
MHYTSVFLCGSDKNVVMAILLKYGSVKIILTCFHCYRDIVLEYECTKYNTFSISIEDNFFLVL